MIMSSSPGGSHSSGSSTAQISISGSDEQQMKSDLRQRKRKVSNRESARRSRMRKQNHLDGLLTQASQISKDNSCILANLNVIRQMCINVEGENSVLRAQMDELTHRLNSLNEIIGCLNQIDNYGNAVVDQMMMMKTMNGDDLFNPWNLMYLNQSVCAGNMVMY
ncbi:bZIP transcription factor 11-like [Impatiens glandulifera]|uniref:bZIP transcription factor 11-like n=1 Tax=Impatiens glandulifera TaxID=253017 RepID=UPI001FB0B95F|nr:bZIP transcription factor 11-like [Impatiens glandulifera]